MRGACECDTFLDIVDLSGKSEISNFDGFVLDENVGRFDVPVEKVLAGEISTGGDDLSGEGDDFLWFSVEEVISDVLFEILFAELEEEIEIIASLLDIEKLDNIGVL